MRNFVHRSKVSKYHKTINSFLTDEWNFHNYQNLDDFLSLTSMSWNPTTIFFLSFTNVILKNLVIIYLDFKSNTFLYQIFQNNDRAFLYIQSNVALMYVNDSSLRLALQYKLNIISKIFFTPCFQDFIFTWSINSMHVNVFMESLLFSLSSFRNSVM